MNARKQSCLLVLTLVLAFGLVFQSQAASYPAPTKYKQTMVRGLYRVPGNDWLPTYGRHFREMAVSANGAKIGFTVKLDGYSDKRLYVGNADGTEFTDVTDKLPPGKLPKDVTSLQMNDTGTRLFFRDYPTGSIYYLDTASPNTSHVALLNAAWVDARKPYTLDAARQHPLFKAPGRDPGVSGVWGSIPAPWAALRPLSLTSTRFPIGNGI